MRKCVVELKEKNRSDVKKVPYSPMIPENFKTAKFIISRIKRG